MITRTRQEVYKLWLEALRSGEYKQGQHRLKSHENRFCCLGVLCDLAVKDGGPSWNEGTSGDSFHGHIYQLPFSISYFMGLDDGSTDSLAELNDEKECSFREIADFIEQTIIPKACGKLR